MTRKTGWINIIMQVAKADSNEAIRGISWGPNRHRCSFEGGHIDKFKKEQSMYM